MRDYTSLSEHTLYTATYFCNRRHHIAINRDCFTSPKGNNGVPVGCTQLRQCNYKLRVDIRVNTPSLPRGDDLVSTPVSASLAHRASASSAHRTSPPPAVGATSPPAVPSHVASAPSVGDVVLVEAVCDVLLLGHLQASAPMSNADSTRNDAWNLAGS